VDKKPHNQHKTERGRKGPILGVCTQMRVSPHGSMVGEDLTPFLGNQNNWELPLCEIAAGMQVALPWEG